MIPYLEHVDDINDIAAFWASPLTFQILLQEGFSSEMIFVKISIGFDSLTHHQFTRSRQFIAAYNFKSEIFYKLEGYDYNDFDKLFIHLQMHITKINYELANEDDLKNLKGFISSFKVEGMDFRKYYTNLKTLSKYNKVIGLKYY